MLIVSLVLSGGCIGPFLRHIKNCFSINESKRKVFLRFHEKVSLVPEVPWDHMLNDNFLRRYTTVIRIFKIFWSASIFSSWYFTWTTWRCLDTMGCWPGLQFPSVSKIDFGVCRKQSIISLQYLISYTRFYINCKLENFILGNLYFYLVQFKSKRFQHWWVLEKVNQCRS
jgi:hypothetical protein